MGNRHKYSNRRGKLWLDKSNRRTVESIKLLDETIPPVKPDEILKATHFLKHEITLKDKNIKPIKQRYYPFSEKLEKIMHEQIVELKRMGIIEESASEWNNPIVMIKRKTESRDYA